MRAPASKSATNRALVLAALGSSPVELVGPLDSDDTRALARCLSEMGASVTATERGWTVGGPLTGKGSVEVELDAALSGTAARFLTAVAAAVPGRYRITGRGRLLERPMRELVEALRSAGAGVDFVERDGFLPVTVRGATLRSGTVTVDASRSSQFVSALLLAGAALPEGLAVRPTGRPVSAPYVETTAEVLAAFGHAVRRLPDGAVEVERGSARLPSYVVPGDWSSALPFLAVAGIAGGAVEVAGVSLPSNDADAGAVEALGRMGIEIERRARSVVARGDPRRLSPADVIARNFPDAVPTLAAVAAHAPGETRIREIGHLRGKESDRVDALLALLTAAGVEAGASDQEIAVTGPPRRIVAPRLPTFDDHRIAMAAALLSLRSEGTLIENPDCVAKSFPSFFRELETILLRG